MLAIRRVLNSCIQVDFDMTEVNDSNKENSAVSATTVGASFGKTLSPKLQVV